MELPLEFLEFEERVLELGQLELLLECVLVLLLQDLGLGLELVHGLEP